MNLHDIHSLSTEIVLRCCVVVAVVAVNVVVVVVDFAGGAVALFKFHCGYFFSFFYVRPSDFLQSI